MGKMGFFGSSLVAAIPAGFMVYLVVMTFMSDNSPSGLLMIMVGSAGLIGLIVALVIPGYILMFVSKSGMISPPKPKEKAGKKEEDVEDEFESADVAADDFEDATFDEDFDESVAAEGGDDWDDWDEEK